MGCLSQGIRGVRFPQFSRMAMGSLHWKEPLALPDSHLGGGTRRCAVAPRAKGHRGA